MFPFPVMTSIIDHMPSHGARTALLDDQGIEVSYAELYSAVLRRALALQRDGVTKGSRLLLVEGNSIDYVIGLWAGFLIGAVVVPIAPELPEGRLTYIVENSGARVALCHVFELERRLSKLIRLCNTDSKSDTLEALRAAVDLNRGPLVSSDLALIIYTSGSTGNPKGVMLSHLNVFSACLSVSTYLGIHANERIFCAIPFTFDYGMHQVTMSALHGAALHIEGTFKHPNLSMRRMERENITCLPIVPAMVRMMHPLKNRYDTSQITKVTNTAAALRPKMIDALREIVPNAQIFSMYGLTECHRCTYLPPEELNTHPTSIGYAIPDTEMWIVNEAGETCTHSAIGELMIRGNTVMQGYWCNPEETAKRLAVDPVTGAKHLKTGDQCHIDSSGRLTFISRTDAVLKIRGVKWVPTTAENELARFPNCAEVVCVAVEDGLGDLRTMAFIVPSLEYQIDPHELRHWCTIHLEPVYVPERIEVTDALPRIQNNKPDLSRLKEIATATFA